MEDLPVSACPFCVKLARLSELPPEEVIWQFPHSVAFLGPWQYYHGYCVLVARSHARELYELSEAERHAYFGEMCLLAAAIAESFGPHKLNYELLGNQVPHLHWHLFPRYRHDPQALQPVWLALDRTEHDPAEKLRLEKGPEERRVTAGKLRKGLEQLLARNR